MTRPIRVSDRSADILAGQAERLGVTHAEALDHLLLKLQQAAPGVLDMYPHGERIHQLADKLTSTGDQRTAHLLTLVGSIGALNWNDPVGQEARYQLARAALVAAIEHREEVPA